jgi:hypothetical protein
MKQSALLRFESSAFAITPGEDKETNPGIYGKALAQWLSQQLAARGVKVTRLIPEDFGWCIGVDSSPHASFVACANTPGCETEWGVIVFAEGGFLARMLGDDKRAESVASLFAAVKEILSTSPNIGAITEEAI